MRDKTFAANDGFLFANINLLWKNLVVPRHVAAIFLHSICNFLGGNLRECRRHLACVSLIDWPKFSHNRLHQKLLCLNWSSVFLVNRHVHAASFHVTGQIEVGTVSMPRNFHPTPTINQHFLVKALAAVVSFFPSELFDEALFVCWYAKFLS